MSLQLGWSVERELGRDERLLWKGRPRGGLRLRPADAYMIPFSFVWGGFAIFWEYSVVTQVPKGHAPGIAFSLFGIPFVVIGLYIMFGRFFVDAKMRSNTEYAVTNRRVIIASGVFGRKVRSIDLQSLPEITIVERADRSGTINFGPASSMWGAQRDPWSFGMPSQSAIEMIDNVRSVYDIIDEARNARTRP